MHKLATRWVPTLITLVTITLIIVAGAATSAHAQSPLNYTGCLKARGKLKQLLRGPEPVRRCKVSETEIHLASADTTDFLAESMSEVIELATEADGRIDQVEQIAAEVSAKVDGNIFVDGILRNTVVGPEALASGDLVDNTAVGASALKMLESPGQGNTAVGSFALESSLDGFFNTAVGNGSLRLATGDNNIALGRDAGLRLRDGDDNIYIGNDGVISESGVTRIGTPGIHTAVFVAGIVGSNSGGDPVRVTADGRLGVPVSSRRYKKEIAPMGSRTGDLMRLRPVTFRYKEPDSAGKHPVQYGLIAEEVAEVYPELVGYSADGKPRTVRYHELNSMLLNELQKQHVQLKKQEKLIAELATRLARLENER